jgi:hypothetical protein
MSKVSVVEMSSYQGTPQYMIDFWKICAFCTQQDTKDTGEEVGATNMLGPLLTPLVQELATEYLSIDVEFGGTDQVCPNRTCTSSRVGKSEQQTDKRLTSEAFSISASDAYQHWAMKSGLTS